MVKNLKHPYPLSNMIFRALILSLRSEIGHCLHHTQKMSYTFAKWPIILSKMSYNVQFQNPSFTQYVFMLLDILESLEHPLQLSCWALFLNLKGTWWELAIKLAKKCWKTLRKISKSLKFWLFVDFFANLDFLMIILIYLKYLDDEKFWISKLTKKVKVWLCLDSWLFIWWFKTSTVDQPLCWRCLEPCN